MMGRDGACPMHFGFDCRRGILHGGHVSTTSATRRLQGEAVSTILQQASFQPQRTIWENRISNTDVSVKKMVAANHEILIVGIANATSDWTPFGRTTRLRGKCRSAQDTLEDRKCAGMLGLLHLGQDGAVRNAYGW